MLENDWKLKAWIAMIVKHDDYVIKQVYSHVSGRI